MDKCKPLVLAQPVFFFRTQNTPDNRYSDSVVGCAGQDFGSSFDRRSQAQLRRVTPALCILGESTDCDVPNESNIIYIVSLWEHLHSDEFTTFIIPILICAHNLKQRWLLFP